MQNDTIIDSIAPTPKIEGFTCKAAKLLIVIALKSAHLLFALYIWYEIDYFFAIAALLIGYLLIGIVRSKLRNSSIPRSQLELNYTDDAIASWYLSRTLCFTSVHHKKR